MAYERIVNTNSGVDFSMVTPVIVINSSGQYDSTFGHDGAGTITGGANLGAGQGVFASVSGPTLQFNSIGAAGNVTVSLSGSTIILSGTGDGAGNIVGPASSTNTAIPTWNGTGGIALNDSDLLYTGGLLTRTGGALNIAAKGGQNLTTSGVIHEVDGVTVNVDATTTANIKIGGVAKFSVAGALTTFSQDASWSAANILTQVSGANQIGTSNFPWSGVFTKQLNGLQITKSVYNEAPVGLFNNSNFNYTVAFAPYSGAINVFLNGLINRPTTDFTISGVTISMIIPPPSGSWMLANYQYAF